MIPVPSGVRVWLAVGRTDMRRGMNGLALQVQETLGRDPFVGDLFVFRGARGDLIKIRMFQASSYGENEVAWDTYRLHQVSYVIGMTFEGPIAYDIQTYQPSTINKLQGSSD